MSGIAGLDAGDEREPRAAWVQEPRPSADGVDVDARVDGNCGAAGEFSWACACRSGSSAVASCMLWRWGKYQSV